MSKDPYMLDENEARKQEEETKNTVVGLICPKKLDKSNKCGVCDYIQTLYEKRPQKGDPVLAWISDKKAKANYFMNVVLPANPNKSIILEIGSNAGSEIVKGIHSKGWVDIAHPHANKGREMLITKSKGDSGYNEYSPSPSLQQADWEIPEETLKNMVNLDNLVDMIKNNELTSDNYMKVSSLKMDETLRFRMCPPHVDQENQLRPMRIVWRHWGVSQDQIDGLEKISYKEKVKQEVEGDDIDDSGMEELWSKSNDRDKVETEETKVVEEKPAKTPACFGKAKYFDEDDEDCQECNHLKACYKEVSKED